MNVFAFTEIPSICPVLSLKDYLVRTAPLCKADSNKLFISLCKPHKPVSSQTLARWITNVMDDAGIDTVMFCQYSTCSAFAAYSETGPGRCLWPKSVDKLSGPVSPPLIENSIKK